MKSIYFFGECLVELRSQAPGQLVQSFAGDVFNSAVYLKRCFAAIQTGMVSTVGKDRLSDQMLQAFEQENLNTELVFRHATAIPGMYLIETDAQGERSFLYWREASAARSTLNFIDSAVVNRLKHADMVFFSGISLAILSAAARKKFFSILGELHQSGVRLVFDPNYRARLWSDTQHAREAYEHAFSLASLAMPGVEDLADLFSLSSADEVVSLGLDFGIEELVIKRGPAAVITVVNGQQVQHQISPVKKVIDTTSAGDAFNGVYLGARLMGREVADSVNMAAQAAATVIQYPGAIVPFRTFSEAMNIHNS